MEATSCEREVPYAVSLPKNLRWHKGCLRVPDGETGELYTLGPEESLVFTLLDGRHSFERIQAEYAAAFGQKLTWDNLLGFVRTAAALGLVRDGDNKPPPPRAVTTATRTGDYSRFDWSRDRSTGQHGASLLLGATIMLPVLMIALTIRWQHLIPRADPLWTWSLLLEVGVVLFLVKLVHESAAALCAAPMIGSISQARLRWSICGPVVAQAMLWAIAAIVLHVPELDQLSAIAWMTMAAASLLGLSLLARIRLLIGLPSSSNRA
jgi:hypothetical protein